MDNYRGTNSVKIKTAELIEAVTKNRDSHQQLYKDAMEGYFVEAKKKLERKLKDIVDNKVVETFRISVPKDHTKDYDRLIKMLEMSQDTELVINTREFEQYVLDEWISSDEKNMMRAMAMSSSNSSTYQIGNS